MRESGVPVHRSWQKEGQEGYELGGRRFIKLVGYRVAPVPLLRAGELVCYLHLSALKGNGKDASLHPTLSN